MGNTLAKLFGFTRKQEDVLPDVPGLIEARDPHMNYNHFLIGKEDITLCGSVDWVSTQNERPVMLDEIGEREVKFHLGFPLLSQMSCLLLESSIENQPICATHVHPCCW